MSLFRPLRSSALQFLAFLVATLLIASCGVQKPATGDPKTPLAAASVTPPASLITEAVYVAKPLDSTTTVARKFLPQSSLMTVAELDRAIRERNGIRGPLQAGEEIVVPALERQPVVEKPRGTAKDADLRAIYLTANTASSVPGLQLVRRWREAGGNAVVFDIKDSDGTLSIAFDHPLAPKRSPLISNLPKYVRYLHSLDLHVIARIALFRDDHIAQNHSRLAVRSRATGEPWRENGKQAWADPSNPEVQDYNLALARFVAASGVDEVQFDYVRFPAEGNQLDARFAFQSDSNRRRSDVINDFLARAQRELRPSGTLLSLDVFGVMAWQRGADLAHTGQDIAQMARHCDVLAPMIYPSHFFGMDGHELPGDAPAHFIAASMDRFRRITEGSGVVLRPWLQAFGWKTRTYSPDYIKTQVLVARQRGGTGFMLWNARNDYSKPFAAMPAMTAEADRYFGRAGTGASRHLAEVQKLPAASRKLPALRRL